MFLSLQNSYVHPHVAVFSNKMHFDGDGCLRHFLDDIIHSFNKNAHALAASPFWRQHALDTRPCVLLLGDSLGDPVCIYDFSIHHKVKEFVL